MTGEKFQTLMQQREYAKICRELSTEPIVLPECSEIDRSFLMGTAAQRAGLIDTAIEEFGKVIKGEQWSMEVTYSERGAAYWIKEQVADALADWKRSLKCRYGDSAGNITPGLILYFVGICVEDNVILQIARSHMEKKLASGWSRNWPAPLARYLLGLEDEQHVLEALAREHPQRQPDEFCRWDFYRGVKNLEQGDRDQYLSCIRSAVDRPNQITWTTEFVLARHELGETPNPDIT